MTLMTILWMPFMGEQTHIGNFISGFRDYFDFTLI